MILLCVGPGQRALLAPRLSRELRAEGYGMRAVLEPEARRFVGPAAFGEDPSGDVEALVFYPATSSMVCRLARGLGDGEGMEAYLGASPPTMVVTEEGDPTLRHPALEENLRLLRDDGVLVCEGISPEEATTRLLNHMGGELSGVRLVVTAGGTREPIDGVRFIGNRSSGKMGKAIARRAARAGALVTVVAANVEEPLEGVDWVMVEDFAGMREQTVRLAAGADALIMAAAVSDFTPAQRVVGKLRRGEELTLELVATEDITMHVRQRYPHLYMIGFAATHGDPRPDAREKLRRKGLDLVVGNDVSGEGIGFGAEENEVYLVGAGSERHIPRAPKNDVASVILEYLKAGVSERKA